MRGEWAIRTNRVGVQTIAVAVTVSAFQRLSDPTRCMPSLGSPRRSRLAAFPGEIGLEGYGVRREVVSGGGVRKQVVEPSTADEPIVIARGISRFLVAQARYRTGSCISATIEKGLRR